jgi:hypothetical protein
MDKMKRILVAIVFLLCASEAHAAHPLITDDTGTQGRGNYQLEFNAEYSRNDEEGTTEKGTEAGTTLSAGITDNVDLVVGVAHGWSEVEEDGVETDESGISDMAVEAKWRFFEKGGFGLALKPGVTFPTGNEDKGFGSGKVTYGVMLIATKELEPWAFHMNFGYTRNENKVQEREDLWHASAAFEVGVAENLTAVANIGVESNADPSSSTEPAFVLGGLIYSLTENVAIDFGVKAGLNNAEADYALLVGIALII